MPMIDRWDSFYVIVGSAAGALIGLQFVVMTLVATRAQRSAAAGAAFATPNIVHFSAVLLLSALLRAPWDAVLPIAVLCDLVGIAGVAYALLTAARMHWQTSYKPDLEDWSFHAVLPFAGYLTLAASAFELPDHEYAALFGIGGATLVLLFTGIHNAWDAVSYHVLVLSAPSSEQQ